MTNEEAIKCLKTIKILKFKDSSETYFFEDVEDSIELAIKALESQPCEDCVSIDAVIDWLKSKDIIKMSNQEENARKELNELFFIQPKPIECEDCVSRESVVDALNQSINLFEATDRVKELPSVTPTIPEVENDYNIGYNCGYADAMSDVAEMRGDEE